jgi:hypothetical protein
MNNLLNTIFFIIVIIIITCIVYNCYKITHVKEGIDAGDVLDPFGIWRMLGDTLFDGFNSVKRFFNKLIDFYDYLRKLFTCYLPSLYEYLKAHLICGVDKIQSFLDCFIYYALEIFGKVIYFPIMLIFWFSESTDIEKSVWESIEDLDKTIYSFTTIHICHYSDKIQKKCYKCDIPKLKLPPKWPL